MNLRKGILLTLVLTMFCLGIGAVVSWPRLLDRADEGMAVDRSLPATLTDPADHAVSEPPLASSVDSVPRTKPTGPKSWTAVPFISQAPTGEWGKSEFQNGCEEAVALMVHAWRTEKTYTPEAAKRELVAMARFQEKKIGQGIDTDTADTAKLLLADYFNIVDSQLVSDFTLDELRSALAQGLIIVPTNGQVLGNPNFTRPGPLQHMLVITGYDTVTREFITNDPGTRKGEGYRYPEATLYAAIREYPTGRHLPITDGKKVMIVISLGTTS